MRWRSGMIIIRASGVSICLLWAAAGPVRAERIFGSSGVRRVSKNGDGSTGDDQSAEISCHQFERDLQSGRTTGIRDWLAETSVTIDRDLLRNLLQIEIAFRVANDPKYDVVAHLAAFAVDFGDLDTIPVAGMATTTAVDVPAQPVDQRFGRFRVHREIGRGGFGCVYLATDEVLHRDVALKIPRATLDADEKARFLREAEASAALEHPNIVTVYDAGEIEGVCFIAAAYCPGKTLAQWAGRRPSEDPRLCARLVRDLALGMEHAHERGVIHRDLKPRNVLLAETVDESGGRILQPKITDFGLAKFLQHHLEDTESSVLMGTPCYMAPELLSGDPIQRPEAIDIYALGVILFELLAGRRPYDSDSVIRVLDGIREGRRVSLRRDNPQVSRDLQSICLKAMARSPMDRFDSCAQLAQDLTRYLDGQVPVARRQTLSTRLTDWLTAPQRIYETGLLSIFLGLAVPLWIFGIIALVSAERLDASISGELLPQAVAVTALLSLPTAWAGYRTLNGSRWWRRYGLFSSFLNAVMTTPPLFGVVLVFPEMYNRYPLGRIIAYSFLSFVFCLQLVQYSILLWTETRQAVKPATVR